MGCTLITCKHEDNLFEICYLWEGQCYFNKLNRIPTSNAFAHTVFKQTNDLIEK